MFMDLIMFLVVHSKFMLMLFHGCVYLGVNSNSTQVRCRGETNLNEIVTYHNCQI